MLPVKQDYSVPLLKQRVSEGTENICCPIVKNNGYLKEQKIFAVLKLSLSMKLDYFNLKLFD